MELVCNCNLFRTRKFPESGNSPYIRHSLATLGGQYYTLPVGDRVWLWGKYAVSLKFQVSHKSQKYANPLAVFAIGISLAKEFEWDRHGVCVLSSMPQLNFVKRNVTISGANVKLMYVLGGIFLYPPPGCLHNSHIVMTLPSFCFLVQNLTELSNEENTTMTLSSMAAV